MNEYNKIIDKLNDKNITFNKFKEDITYEIFFNFMKKNYNDNKIIGKIFFDIIDGKLDIKKFRKDNNIEDNISKKFVDILISIDDDLGQNKLFNEYNIKDIQLKKDILYSLKKDLEEYCKNSDLYNMVVYRNKLLSHKLFRLKY